MARTWSIMQTLPTEVNIKIKYNKILLWRINSKLIKKRHFAILVLYSRKQGWKYSVNNSTNFISRRPITKHHGKLDKNTCQGKLSYKKEAPKIYRHNEESKKREQHPNKDQLACSLSWGQLLEYPYMFIWLGILCWNCCIWWNGLCRLNCCIWWNGLCRLNCCMGCACRISWGCVAKFGGGGTQLSWSMRGVTIVLMSSKVMSWMLFLFLSFFGVFLRLKYF